MIYRMLAINLDGALLTTKGKLHKVTRESLREVANKGVEIVLFTSQSYHNAAKIAQSLPCQPHIIANQGGFIAEQLSKPVHVKRISESNTLDICRLLESMDCHIRIIHDEYTLANTIHFPIQSRAKVRWAKNDSSLYTQQYVESLTEYLIVESISPQQIDVYFEHQEEQMEAILALRAMFENITMQVQDDGKLTILPENINLVNGMKYLAADLGIEWPQIVVIGCETRDADLVEAAGLGIAVANATLAVKNVADWITSSGELGVSYVIREIFRKQQPIDFLRRMNIIR